MAMSLAPMLGPILGGGLDELFGWRSSFLVFFGLGVVLFSLCWADLGETNNTRSETFLKQFRSYPELLRSHRFWGYTSCMVFSVGAYFAFLGGVPFVANYLLSLSPTVLGICIGSISVGYGIGSFLSARYSMRYDLTTVMITGRSVACIGLAIGLIFVLTGFINLISIFGATIFVGLGNGITLPGSSSGVMSVRTELAGSASGLSGALMVGVGALFTSFTGMILTEENGAYMLLTIMLISSLISLAAAVYVLRIDLRGNQEMA
jgi:predicted MFS family arabinose efflux permease